MWFILYPQSTPPCFFSSSLAVVGRNCADGRETLPHMNLPRLLHTLRLAIQVLTSRPVLLSIAFAPDPFNSSNKCPVRSGGTPREVVGEIRREHPRTICCFFPIFIFYVARAPVHEKPKNIGLLQSCDLCSGLRTEVCGCSTGSEHGLRFVATHDFFLLFSPFFSIDFS